jgi:transposase
MNSVRYNGIWYKVIPKPYEPDRQTIEISWRLIREPLVLSPEAYRIWYANEQRKVKVLYPSFRKDGA